MKSKLSTNILKQGDRSFFMRSAKGRFALREWNKFYPEHIADRYQKALFDEDIVVFPAGSLHDMFPRLDCLPESLTARLCSMSASLCEDGTLKKTSR